MAVPGGWIADKKRLTEAMEVLREGAAKNAAPFSRRIPVSMTVSYDGPGYGHIELHKEIAPNGYPFEYGVWHPLNRPKWAPKRHWYKQPLRPFIQEAIDGAPLDESIEVYAEVVDDWAISLGCTPGDY